MSSDIGHTDVGQQYAAASAAHYTKKDLREAFQLYMRIMATHPDSREAGYARSQINNIVNVVVPGQELLDAQVHLVLAHFDGKSPPDMDAEKNRHAS